MLVLFCGNEYAVVCSGKVVYLKATFLKTIGRTEFVGVAVWHAYAVVCSEKVVY